MLSHTVTSRHATPVIWCPAAQRRSYSASHREHALELPKSIKLPWKVHFPTSGSGLSSRSNQRSARLIGCLLPRNPSVLFCPAEVGRLLFASRTTVRFPAPPDGRTACSAIRPTVCCSAAPSVPANRCRPHHGLRQGLPLRLSHVP